MERPQRRYPPCRYPAARCLSWALGLFLATGTPGTALSQGAKEGAGADSRSQTLLVVPVEGPITVTAVERLKKRLLAKLRADDAMAHVVFRINSPGGELEAGLDLAEFIFSGLAEHRRGLRTIAFIPPGQRASFVAALVGFAADDLYLGTGSRIGTPTQEVDAYGFIDKAAADPRVAEGARRYANQRSSALLVAMVSREHDDIVRIGTPKRPIFLGRADYEARRANEPALQIEEPERPPVELPAGQLLEVDPVKAKELGLIRETASDLADLRLRLGLEKMADENVRWLEGGPLQPPSPGAQRFVDILNHPFVRFLLILGGVLGIFLEIKMLGTIVPGAVGLLCLALFFGGSLLPVTGAAAPSATVWEVAVFPLGLGLIAVEFFVPGMAIFALSGTVLCLVSIVISMVPPGDAAGEALTIQGAIQVLVYGLGAASVGILLVVRYLPRSPLFARRGIISDAEITGVSTAGSQLEAQSQSRALVGRTAVVVSALRPAGKARLDDGFLLDVVADGEFIARDETVRVLESRGGRTLVERVPPPTEGPPDAPTT